MRTTRTSTLRRLGRWLVLGLVLVVGAPPPAPTAATMPAAPSGSRAASPPPWRRGRARVSSASVHPDYAFVMDRGGGGPRGETGSRLHAPNASLVGGGRTRPTGTRQKKAIAGGAASTPGGRAVTHAGQDWDASWWCSCPHAASDAGPAAASATDSTSVTAHGPSARAVRLTPRGGSMSPRAHSSCQPRRWRNRDQFRAQVAQGFSPVLEQA